MAMTAVEPCAVSTGAPRPWIPATDLISGAALPGLLDAAAGRWRAAPAAAAALAWKSYTYRLVLPAVAGYVTARRVPLPRPDHVLLRYPTPQPQPLVTVVLHRPEIAALPGDAMTTAGHATPVPDDAALAAALRAALIDDHLAPLAERFTERARLGRRTLLGSVASGVAHAVSRSTAVPAAVRTAVALLSALGLADLVDLDESPRGGFDVHRKTCCLAFTLPDPKICADCCLRAPGD